MSSEAKEVIQYIRSLERRVSALERLEGGGGGGAPFPGFGDAEGQPVDVAAASADGTSLSASRRDHAHTIGAGVVTSTMLADGAALAEILDDDGAGSGLDADLLDGQEGAYYLPAGTYTAADLLSKLLSVDGAGSGLDADLLDGVQGAGYAKLSPPTSDVGYISVDDDLYARGGGANGVRVGYTGVRIKAPDGTAGWSRGISMFSPDEVTQLAQFGFYGVTTAGVAALTNAFIGPNNSTPWQKWTNASSYIATPLHIDGALTFDSTNLDIYHGTDGVLRNYKNGTSYLKLGIGQTANAAQALYFYSQADSGLSAYMVRNSGANGSLEWRQYGTGNFLLRTIDAAAIVLSTADTVRMTVDADGDVGIGTTTPRGTFHVFDGVGYHMFVSKTNITTTAQTIIPDGTGDVTEYLHIDATYVSGGVAFSLSAGVVPGITTNSNVGTETFQLALSAGGALTVKRTAGTNAGSLSAHLRWV